MEPYWHNEQHGLSIYLGDCLDVMPGLGREFDLVFADPPFGIGYTGHQAAATAYGTGFAVIHGDEAPDTEWIAHCRVTDTGAWYVKTTWKVLRTWADALAEYADIASYIVWDKCSHVAGAVNGGYAGQSELLLFAATGQHKTRCFDTDIWRIARQTCGVRTRRHGHPYECPVALPARAIRNSSNEGDTVLDPFLGSGTTLVACYRLGRQGVGIEISEEYCELAARRLEKEIAQGRLFEPAETMPAPKAVQGTLEVEP